MGAKIFLIIVLIMGVLGAVGLTMGLRSDAPPLPEWIEGLPEKQVDATAEFDRRVKAQYPVGSDAKAMGEDLRAAGFSDQALVGDTHMYKRSDQTFPCVTDRTVTWKSTGKTIASIGGSHWVTCP